MSTGPKKSLTLSDNRLVSSGAGSILFLNSDGSVQKSADVSSLAGNALIQARILQSDGKILFTFGDHGIGRLTAEGTVDPTFDSAAAASALTSVGLQPNGYTSAPALALSPDGSIIVASVEKLYTSTLLVSLKSNGQPDSSALTTRLSGSVNCMAVDTHGSLLVGGTVTDANGIPRNHIVRIITGGTHVPFSLSDPARTNGTFSVSIRTVPGRKYTLESTQDPGRSGWTPLRSLDGDGRLDVLEDPAAGSDRRFYRVRLE